MAKFMRMSLLLMILPLSVLTASCSQSDREYCGSLEARFTDAELQVYLLDWVEKNIVDKSFSPEEAMPAGGMVPGRHWLTTAEIEWSRLDYSQSSQVRLVGQSLTDVDSVFFGERSRRGVLVRMPASSTFGVNKEYLSLLSERVAVYCMPR